MAVHNGLPYLEQALRSILDQTLRDIEIIIVDDASTDGTGDILRRLAAEDARIRVMTNETNLRLPASLNRGLKSATAPLIARMDADDISLPTRLRVQKDFMDLHPEVVLLGASIHTIDRQGKILRTSVRGRDSVAVRWLARFNMPLTHPTFMFRRLMPNGSTQYYSEEAGYAEDYDYVVRALQHGEIFSLPDVLLSYRTHDISISRKNWREQQQHARDIAMRLQACELPDEVFQALAPFRQSYYDLEPASPEKIFSGLRVMLSHDLKRFPSHRSWLKRQTAQLAATTFLRCGRQKGAILRAFLESGRDFLPALGLRYLETRRLLPLPLRADASMQRQIASAGPAMPTASQQ